MQHFGFSKLQLKSNYGQMQRKLDAMAVQSTNCLVKMGTAHKKKDTIHTVKYGESLMHWGWWRLMAQAAELVVRCNEVTRKLCYMKIYTVILFTEQHFLKCLVPKCWKMLWQIETI